MLEKANLSIAALTDSLAQQRIGTGCDDRQQRVKFKINLDRWPVMR
ncbi:MAG: hypothetical protein QNJ63_31275 [Calothrix sp. MO_192.B10]|nr:hypothetical protein [Calothrix sp. MO_192.B10]